MTNHDLKGCDHCCTRIEQLTVRLRGRLILDAIDLHVNCREILAIVGPNGAGKSTLLKALLGLVPFSGKIIWQVRGNKGQKARIGYVPQSLDLDSSTPVSVADFFASALARRPVWLGISRAERERIHANLALVSAAQLINKRLGELSGGELQRVLLALALTSQPDILLLDEPVSGVDMAGLDLFHATVGKLRDTMDVAIILVTHDLLGVAPHVNRMLLLNQKVMAEGPPHEVLASPHISNIFGRSLSPTPILNS